MEDENVCEKLLWKGFCIHRAAIWPRGQSPDLGMAKPGPDLGVLLLTSSVTCAELRNVSTSQFSLRENRASDRYLTGCLGRFQQRCI